MILSILEFFQNLPAKFCQNCGEEIEEQHECYGNTCYKCIGIKDIK
ncbi:protein YhfH [Bacillus andreraoultii]|nr:protein YhfH [Bacillus andreraoultii]